MFCRKCGTQNLDNNYQCTQCGEILHSAAPAPTVVVVDCDNTMGGFFALLYLGLDVAFLVGFAANM
jgi:zinc ribbon protein